MAKRDWLKVEGYDDMLDSLALHQPDDSQSCIAVRISDEQPMIGVDPLPPVDVWIPSEHVRKLDGLRNLIRTGLEELGHPASQPFVDSLLPLIALAPRSGRKKLAYMFSRFRTTFATQTLVFPRELKGGTSELTERPIRIGEFSLKPFDSSHRISAAFAAGSPLGINTATLDERDGSWSIERALTSVPYCDVRDYEIVLETATSQIIPWLRSQGLEAGPAGMWLSWLFYENYTLHYGSHLLEGFLSDFREAQAPHVALGGSLFPIHDVFGLKGCFFLDHWRDASFNSSLGVIFGVEVTGGLSTKLSAQFADFLASLDLYGTLGSLTGEACRRSSSLLTFTRVLVTAREQAQEGRSDVAFLLCCTALEHMLVGSREEPIARTLSRRLGALHALSADVSFKDAVNECKRLYDTRSQFVHNAHPVGPEDLNRLQELCTLVYIAAVRASISMSTTEKDQWTTRWHVALDYVGSSLAAGATVDASIAADAGIQVPSDGLSSVTGSTTTTTQ